MDFLIGDVIDNSALASPNSLAVDAESGSLTFREFANGGTVIALHLMRRQLGARHRVIVMVDDPIMLCLVWLAIARCGAVFIPLNAAMTGAEALDAARLVDPHMVIAENLLEGPASELVADLGCVGVDLDELIEVVEIDEGVKNLERPVLEIDDSSAHAMYFTSGSTGRPKAAIVSHRAAIWRSFPGSQIEHRGTLVCPFPLFHMAAWILATQQWHARGAIVFTQATGSAICQAIAEHRAERTYLIPAMWNRVIEYLNTPEGASLNLSSLRFVDTGTSVTTPELLDRLAELFPSAARRVFYGSTEMGNVLSLGGTEVDTYPYSCGTPTPLVRTRVDGDGVLYVSSPAAFDGYYNAPEETAATFVDGWYRTGDRVEVDRDGFFYVTGRADDLIRTGGESVSPHEVELVIARFPGVKDVGVVGVPDETWGSIVCAVLVCDGRVPTLDELHEFCRPLLARHKIPRRLAVTDRLERTHATGQLRRRQILDGIVNGRS